LLIVNALRALVANSWW